jgi:hypothetical protein
VVLGVLEKRKYFDITREALGVLKKKKFFDVIQSG